MGSEDEDNMEETIHLERGQNLFEIHVKRVSLQIDTVTGRTLFEIHVKYGVFTLINFQKRSI